MKLNAYLTPCRSLALLLGPLLAAAAIGCSETDGDNDGSSSPNDQTRGDASGGARDASTPSAGRGGSGATNRAGTGASANAGTSASAGAGGDMEEVPVNCEAPINMLPMALSCTGLYADI